MKQVALLFVLLYGMVTLLASCKNNHRAPAKQDLLTPTGMELDSGWHKMDSLVVVFYKDPYGEDSLRYTRYFTQASVTDTASIALLREQLARPFSMQEKRKPCRGEGKIWCFASGKIFQTLYFSTRCDDCCYVYLIRDGNFYYTSIEPRLTGWLSGIKTRSSEPPNESGVAE